MKRTAFLKVLALLPFVRRGEPSAGELLEAAYNGRYSAAEHETAALKWQSVANTTITTGGGQNIHIHFVGPPFGPEGPQIQSVIHK